MDTRALGCSADFIRRSRKREASCDCRCYRSASQAFQRPDCDEFGIIQLLQLRWQRTGQGEGDPNSANIWRWTLWAASILWNSRCAYENGSRYCLVLGY